MHTMLHILKGSGSIQVDFKNYPDWNNKIIFLEKGQYIKFLAAGFEVRKVEFNDEQIFRNKDVRVLFKHLISLGYIQFTDCADYQKFLNDTLLTNTADFIDISSQQWYWQNPFNANKKEYHIIFDVKDVIDKEYRNHLSNNDLSKLIKNYDINPHALYSNKIGITIKRMFSNKRLLESQKEIAFTNKSIKEVSYELGYKDPAYFTRVFKSTTGKSPLEFKEEMNVGGEDPFLKELFNLINNFHTKERSVEFYAHKMNVSVKTLSGNVRSKLQVPISQLIRSEIIRTAQQLLLEKTSIHEVAFHLGFEEANHFSAFFKLHTSVTPSQFIKKYNQ